MQANKQANKQIKIKKQIKMHMYFPAQGNGKTLI